MTRPFPLLIGIALILGASLWLVTRGCSRSATLTVEPTPIEAPAVSTAAVAAVPVASPVIAAPVATLKPKATPAPVVKTTKVVAPPTPVLAPPPVQIHKELIPKDVEIVRVYYADSIGGPDSTIEFDINGSGFTNEFQQMIKAESGHSLVTIRDLTLKTPNQIHGTLVIDKKAGTALSFPRVLIKDKIVFQAPEPFAVIRPGEVLNLIFVEMGESGRTGRFRIFTNLTPAMLNDFHVIPSTPLIQVGPLMPALPFVVDGTIVIGGTPGGEYGLKVMLKDKVLWARDGAIRVVRPNVGQTGLAQRVQAVDGFHRPGDKAVFALQGSGFRPEDVGLLNVKVKGLEITRSTFVYLAAGRMEVGIWVPANAAPGVYGLTISQGDSVLLDSPKAFSVVEKNWLRELDTRPSLKPGEKGELVLRGRDLDAAFVSALKLEVDEPALEVGAFTWKSAVEATAPLSVGMGVKPGDYLIHLSKDGKTVNAQLGNLIRIEKN